MSRLFPLRCFYIKDLEVYVLMLTWEVCGLMMGFCMSILYKNEQDFLLYFLLYIYILFCC